jgi:transcriptional regulator with PAS, ATPase and Fis domain
MSLPLQAKLLRVIQDGVVRRVGSEQPDAVVDVRFVSATNRDPQQAVQSGILRGDLFYRLRVVPIHLPPLRKRPEDIALLANHFLSHYWRHHRQTPDRTPRLSDAAIAFLRSRPWKGNVRELQNVIEHVAVLVDPDHVIEPDDIPIYDDVPGGDAPSEQTATMVVPDEPYHMAKDRIIAQFEKDYLTRLIARAGGNMSKAARLAKVDRTTLYRLMEKHSILREEDAGAIE